VDIASILFGGNWALPHTAGQGSEIVEHWNWELAGIPGFKSLIDAARSRILASSGPSIVRWGDVFTFSYICASMTADAIEQHSNFCVLQCLSRKWNVSIVFIEFAVFTGNTSLEPLREGLFVQIHVNLSWHVFGRNWTLNLRITTFVESRALHHWAKGTDESLKIPEDSLETKMFTNAETRTNLSVINAYPILRQTFLDEGWGRWATRVKCRRQPAKFSKHDISSASEKAFPGGFGNIFGCSTLCKKRCFSTREFSRFLSTVSLQRRTMRSDVPFQT